MSYMVFQLKCILFKHSLFATNLADLDFVLMQRAIEQIFVPGFLVMCSGSSSGQSPGRNSSLRVGPSCPFSSLSLSTSVEDICCP